MDCLKNILSWIREWGKKAASAFKREQSHECIPERFSIQFNSIHASLFIMQHFIVLSSSTAIQSMCSFNTINGYQHLDIHNIPASQPPVLNLCKHQHESDLIKWMHANDTSVVAVFQEAHHTYMHFIRLGGVWNSFSFSSVDWPRNGFTLNTKHTYFPLFYSKNSYLTKKKMTSKSLFSQIEPRFNKEWPQMNNFIRFEKKNYHIVRF